MKTWMWIAGMSLLCARALADGDECRSLGKKADDLSDELKSYQPPVPAQGTESGQRNGQGTHSGNATNAVNAATTCTNQLNAIAKKFDKLRKEAQEKSCDEAKDKAKAGSESAKSKAATCAAAGKEAAAQGEKSSDNKDKMGEKEKGGGSGGGGMPQLPQMPQQKKDNSPDPVKAEAARQARITSCKNAANNTLNSRKAACETTYVYNPTYPVADVLQKQNECKQNAIFASQTDQNNCDAANPPGTTASLPTPPDNFDLNSAASATATASTISTTH